MLWVALQPAQEHQCSYHHWISHKWVIMFTILWQKLQTLLIHAWFELWLMQRDSVQIMRTCIIPVLFFLTFLWPKIQYMHVPWCTFHTDDNYTTILQRICLDILCNKTSGTITDFTNVCEFLIACPLEAGRNYQITEHVNRDAPNVSFQLNSDSKSYYYSKTAPSLPLLSISSNPLYIPRIIQQTLFVTPSLLGIGTHRFSICQWNFSFVGPAK